MSLSTVVIAADRVLRRRSMRGGRLEVTFRQELIDCNTRSKAIGIEITEDVPPLMAG